MRARPELAEGGSVHASDVRRVGVAGAGLIGHSVALDFAVHGYETRLYARSQDRLDQALQNIQTGLELLEGLGRLNHDQVAVVPTRIQTGTRLEDVFADTDLVIEAISEDLSLKQQIFGRLDAACPPRTILASTTSALLPSALARATQRPDRVLVAHYFNPPALVPLVELVRGPETSDETVTIMRDVLLHNRKRPVVVQKEVPGFIANRLQAALLREALALVQDGVVEPADLDTVVKYSFGPRLGVAGVFQIADLAGLDLYLAVAEQLLRDLCSSPHVPSILRDKVERGELGVKSGQGFYAWTPEAAAAIRDRIGRTLVALGDSD